MVVSLKRYLGNAETLEVHDTDNVWASCRLGEIPSEHVHWYDTLEAAKNDRPYVNCSWCLGGFRTP